MVLHALFSACNVNMSLLQSFFQGFSGLIHWRTTFLVHIHSCSPIGEGQFGRVFKAIAEGICPYDSNKKVVAVKTLKGETVQCRSLYWTWWPLILEYWINEWLHVMWTTFQCSLYKAISFTVYIHMRHCVHMKHEAALLQAWWVFIAIVSFASHFENTNWSLKPCEERVLSSVALHQAPASLVSRPSHVF